MSARLPLTLLGAMALVACGGSAVPTESSSAPFNLTPIPLIDGNYTLTLTPASDCASLGLGTLEWQVEAIPIAIDAHFRPRITLPHGQTQILATFYYPWDVENSLQGNLMIEHLPLGNGNDLEVATTVLGNVTPGLGGHGAVLTAPAIGWVQLSKGGKVFASCEDHHTWSLMPR
jgi:hypothetical protein